MIFYITLAILIIAVVLRAIALFIENDKAENITEAIGYIFTAVGIIMLFCVLPIVGGVI